jgi:hypothetical protein
MKYLVIALVLVLATSAFGFEKKAYQMREDFGHEALYDCALQYYYYIPCPTYSWFWAFTGWAPGDIIGEYFTIGDLGTGGYDPCDPATCQTLEVIRILDFAGYGTVYPGLFTVEFDAWCPPCPLYHLWNSGPIETGYAWNYIYVEPPLCLTQCWDPYGVFCVVVTATHTGTDGVYPAWGMDNISTAIETGCEMHDYGCLPAVWPRVAVNSGYFGNGDPCMYNPPLWFCDGRDTTLDCSQYGWLELAWRIYLICAGPTANETSTWGNIKTMYR